MMKTNHGGPKSHRDYGNISAAMEQRTEEEKWTDKKRELEARSRPHLRAACGPDRRWRWKSGEKKKSGWCLGSEDDEGREVEAEGGREQSSAAAAC